MKPPAEYNPKRIEPAWQRAWQRQGLFRARESAGRTKFYCLVMFPYPSGRIHMGHVRNYAIGDVIARYKMLKGEAVLHPMGWDAFGLPAENAAIEKGIHPAEWTRDNIQTMKKQLNRLGLSYDWTREINTSSEAYYRWNQWFFIKMYERGLAYKKMSAVNWCISCETVLANEQVIDGQCWRCETAVEQRELSQWFFKITAYAEELLRDCDRLTGWPERVITMQRNWIGRSDGVELEFQLAEGAGSLKIFTTRPDTLFGATFMVMAPEHPMIPDLIRGKRQAHEVEEFVERVRQQDKRIRTAQDLEKEGVFTGSYAVNPMNGEKIPIWVANFVLMEYGTGAIMAVPAHDQRDYEFAKKYGMTVRVVIQHPDGGLQSSTLARAYEEEEGHLVDSDQFSGLSPEEAKGRIAAYIERQGIGKRAVNYRLRDWGISRQRYWGAPIPMVYCERCGVQPVPERSLPVKLPRKASVTGNGGSPLAENRAFLNTTCPKCRRKARRETDTMDTFVDSSWYFLRYADPGFGGGPVQKKKVSYWMPVDQYIGGIEHAVLHLLYARFFTKVVRDLGLIRLDEPFTRLLTQGMVVKETYFCHDHHYLFPEQVASGGHCKLCIRSGHGTVVEVGRTEKMSKSKKNVIDLEAFLDRYGADTARVFTLFAAPPEKDLEWSHEGVEGTNRFLNRVWRLVVPYAASLKGVKSTPGAMGALPDDLKEIRRSVHRTIQKVTDDIEDDFHFNTAIAALMELVNTLYLARDRSGPPVGKGPDAEPGARLKKVVWKEGLNTLLILLSPFAPHIAEELWRMLGNGRSVLKAGWPCAEPDLLAAERIGIVVQVNGRLRGKIEVPAGMAEEEIKQRAVDDPKVKAWIAGKSIRRLIYVPGRLVNVVV